MWTWLLNPKNLLIAILIVGCVVLALFGLWWRAASAVSASKAEKAKVEAAELKSQVEEYQKDMFLIKAHAERLQQISSEAAVVRDAIGKIQRRELTDEEAAVAAAISARFIGVLKARGGEILSKSDKAGAD